MMCSLSILHMMGHARQRVNSPMKRLHQHLTLHLPSRIGCTSASRRDTKRDHSDSVTPISRSGPGIFGGISRTLNGLDGPQHSSL